MRPPSGTRRAPFPSTPPPRASPTQHPPCAPFFSKPTRQRITCPPARPLTAHGGRKHVQHGRAHGRDVAGCQAGQRVGREVHKAEEAVRVAALDAVDEREHHDDPVARLLLQGGGGGRARERAWGGGRGGGVWAGKGGGRQGHVCCWIRFASRGRWQCTRQIAGQPLLDGGGEELRSLPSCRPRPAPLASCAAGTSARLPAGRSGGRSSQWCRPAG